ncbi:hypothetical protein BGX34_000743 [Mortierella sp. NVP85]|nr:hypothetical protein BGX34_000743 [Mortierella sp. NVP85]
MRSIASDDTAPQRLQPQKQKHTKTKKSSFIRGRAGFAWLEKRLPPASMGLDDEMLNNKAWTYQDQERHLDEIEIERAKGYVDRVTDQHYLMKDVMGGNYHVPMDLTFKRVLENGCGAGDWTLDMASEVPEADFVGCPQISFTKPDADPNAASTPSRPRGLLGADQSQQQGSAPGSANAGAGAKTTIRPTIRPRNCNFYPDVPINRIPYSDDHFDFVYQRRQNVVLLANEWDRASSELFRVLKPGGWVQLLEPDLFLQGGGELCQFAGRYCVGMFEGTGRNPNVIHELQPMLEKAGFVNVEIKIYSIPLGWGGVIGEAMLVNQRQFVNEMEPIYVRQGHGSSEQYQGLVGKIFEEIVERKAYINYYVAIGQKPDTNPSPFRGGYDFMNSILKLERCVDDDDDDDDNNNNNNGNDNSDDNKVTMAIESLEISKPQTEPQAVAATELASSSA